MILLEDKYLNEFWSILQKKCPKLVDSSKLNEF